MSSGKFGEHIRKHLCKYMKTSVRLHKPQPENIVEQTILPKDTNNETILLAIVKDLAEQIAFRLRKRKQISDIVQLEIHYSDGYKSCSLG